MLPNGSLLMNVLGPKRRLNRRGAVSLIFATALIPMLMLIAFAIDYGLYAEAQAQLQTAADSAAFHAARIASQILQQKPVLANSAYQQQALTDGRSAGEQWFAAQLGILPLAGGASTLGVNVTCDATPCKTITAYVSYNGKINTQFGPLLPPNWNIVTNATAVISVPSYIENLIMLDNSSSMLIAASAQDIANMDALTPCSAQGTNAQKPIDEDYSWAYIPNANGTYISQFPASALTSSPPPDAAPKTSRIPYGYGTFAYQTKAGTPKIIPLPLPTPSASPAGPGVLGRCDHRYDGAAYGIGCSYPGYLLYNSVNPTGQQAGYCKNGLGGPGSVDVDPLYNGGKVNAVQGLPQAPCAFACHNDYTGKNNDYFGLARSNGIKLRFDVVQDAASAVIGDMQQASNVKQLSVGVYTFNGPIVSQNGLPAQTGFTPVYPGGGQEAGGDLGTAETAVTAITPPLTPDQANTDMPYAFSRMNAAIAKTDGTGTTAANPEKNLFIVTDGLADYDVTPGPGGCPTGSLQDGPNCRIQHPIDPVSDCQPIKNKGVTIYVLYTQYLPLPNPFYIQNDMPYVEPVNNSPDDNPGDDPPIEAALRACASQPKAPYFLKAINVNDISKDLKQAFDAANGSAGLLTN